MLNTLKHNLKQLLIVTDQWIATLVCIILIPHKKVYADLTFSAQCWIWSKKDKIDLPRKVVDFLFFFDHNHCEESYKSEIQHLHLPPECR